MTFWVLTLAKFRFQGTAFGLPPQTSADRLAVFGTLAYGLLGAGLATLSVRKRLRRSADGRLTAASMGAGIGAFFGGMLLVLLVVAIDDVASLARQIGR